MEVCIISAFDDQSFFIAVDEADLDFGVELFEVGLVKELPVETETQLFVSFARDEVHIVRIVKDECIDDGYSHLKYSNNFIPFDIYNTDEAILSRTDCYSQIRIDLNAVDSVVMRDYLLLEDQFAICMDVRIAVVVYIQIVAVELVQVLPDYDLSID